MRKRIAWLITTSMVASAFAVPGMALAHTNEAIAETGGMELALLGSGFTVGIGLDEVGNISSVDVEDPSAPTPDPEAAPEEAEDGATHHRIHFESADGETRIDVMAKKHKLTSKVKAGALDDLLGPHEWSAVLFPESSEDPTTVPFAIGEDGSITLGTISGPGATDAVVAEGDDEDDEHVVMITFTLDGYTKVLKIKVDVDDDDDEDGPSAVLKVELRAKDRQRLRDSLEVLAGDRIWNGRLCDGSPVSVAYKIGENGSLTIGEISVPDGQEVSVKEQQRGFQVRFDGTKARLHVKFGETDEGTWDLKVDAKTTEKCKHEGEERGKKDRSDRERAKDHGEDETGDD